MRKVLIQHTTKPFKSKELAEKAIEFMKSLPTNRPNTKYLVTEHNAIIMQFEPDNEIAVSDFESLKAAGSLPALFENQTFIIGEI